MNGTMWYKSKRLWLGAITLVGSFLQYKYGLVLDGPTQGMILGLIAIIIGIITKGPIEWEDLSASERKKVCDKNITTEESKPNEILRP